MRCLYCGKELALLKRWTGGGEFCSDAHRQQYQEEYNQLALNRLLQSQAAVEQKPVEPPPAAAKSPLPKTPEPKPEVPAPVPVRAAETPARPRLEAEPVRAAKPEPEPASAIAAAPAQVNAPADPAGFFVEVPAPALVETWVLSHPDYAFEPVQSPVLPEAVPVEHGDQEGVPPIAGRVPWNPAARIAQAATKQIERRLEVREFTRTAPVAEFKLTPGGQSGVMEICEEPMEILIFPHPPQGSPSLWQEAERNFAFDVDLGELGRVPFSTTGFEEESAAPEKAAVPAFTPAPAVVHPPKLQEPPRVVVETPAPVFVEPPKPAPAPVVVAEVKPEPVPERATKPLPLTLHGLSAGRGKPVQVFQAAATAGIDLQIPRSTALPLRAVMSLSSAPAVVEEKPVEEKKPEERRTAVIVKPPARSGNGGANGGSGGGRPDPRFANGKNRKPEVRVTPPEPAKAEEKAAPVAEPAPAKPAEKPVEKPVEKLAEKKVAEPAKVPEPVKVAESKPAVSKPPEAKVPKPAEPKKPAFVTESPAESPSPLSPSFVPPDLDLPHLTLDNQSSWSRLPIAAKVGGAVVLAAGLAAMIFLGGGKPKASPGAGQVVEAGAPLAVLDSGWITDWGAEPGVRRVHEVSVLRPSLTLSDYRLEFQAQIETKAIGWVYRAKDGKNYYVNRLEVVKPGLDPTVAFVRFAVINGEEQPRTQVPLSLPVHVDTLYKVRFDAVGDKFTTWVLDQKVDEWTDSRLKVGGVGLYNERGERMSLKGGVNVVPLAIRK